MVLNGAIASSSPIPKALALLTDHLFVGKQFASRNVPLVKSLDCTHLQILLAIVASLLAADREPPLVVLHIPHVDLSACTMMADYFKQLPVCLIVVEAVEVDELFS